MLQVVNVICYHDNRDHVNNWYPPGLVSVKLAENNYQNSILGIKLENCFFFRKNDLKVVLFIFRVRHVNNQTCWKFLNSIFFTYLICSSLAYTGINVHYVKTGIKVCIF